MTCNNCGNQSCIQNGQLWQLIYDLQKTNRNKKIILTPQQRFAFCNYLNGKPYNRKVIKEFIQK